MLVRRRGEIVVLYIFVFVIGGRVGDDMRVCWSLFVRVWVLALLFFVMGKLLSFSFFVFYGGDYSVRFVGCGGVKNRDLLRLFFEVL